MKKRASENFTSSEYEELESEKLNHSEKVGLKNLNNSEVTDSPTKEIVTMETTPMEIGNVLEHSEKGNDAKIVTTTDNPISKLTVDQYRNYLRTGNLPK